MDALSLEESLKSELGSELSVKKIESALGASIEINLAQSEALSRAETLKGEFFSQVDDVSRLEADAAIFESGTLTNDSLIGSDAPQKYKVARERLDSIANELFFLSKMEQKAQDAPNTNDLRKMASRAYTKINEDYQAGVRAAIEKRVKYDSISFEIVSASLSGHFISTALWVVGVSSILAIIAVFFVFRSFIPSAAVLIGATADITIALGAMGLFGIPLTLASFAALLMLIGYSLDTDILLTMRTLKRSEGHARERAFGAMKTGVTMNITAMAAFSALLILSILTNISTYYEISAVALAGLVGDLFATWGLNAVIVLWYAEKKEKEAGEAKSKFTAFYGKK
ncbi:hypothetical protein COV61_02160 [Candidatus Micrarchaeota archaeon CG11_big_fil_rev_8_21_14_0_20_47_5]|nr:MAG: hypothetical protein COV61_02160 [Candidatus Micrarchaeota archaeon CG11_big_fil_rev_8_21_14_0_20_47_5]